MWRGEGDEDVDSIGGDVDMGDADDRDIEQSEPLAPGPGPIKAKPKQLQAPEIDEIDLLPVVLGILDK